MPKYEGGCKDITMIEAIAIYLAVILMVGLVITAMSNARSY
jgi:hypothetical protein